MFEFILSCLCQPHIIKLSCSRSCSPHPFPQRGMTALEGHCVRRASPSQIIFLVQRTGGARQPSANTRDSPSETHQWLELTRRASHAWFSLRGPCSQCDRIRPFSSQAPNQRFRVSGAEEAALIGAGRRWREDSGTTRKRGGRVSLDGKMKRDVCFEKGKPLKNVIRFCGQFSASLVYFFHFVCIFYLGLIWVHAGVKSKHFQAF